MIDPSFDTFASWLNDLLWARHCGSRDSVSTFGAADAGLVMLANKECRLRGREDPTELSAAILVEAVAREVKASRVQGRSDFDAVVAAYTAAKTHSDDDPGVKLMLAAAKQRVWVLTARFALLAVLNRRGRVLFATNFRLELTVRQTCRRCRSRALRWFIVSGASAGLVK